MRLLLLAGLVLFAGGPGLRAEEGKGTVERIKVHGRGLEGNLEGDSPDREVSVYLPPSYGKETARRYPVVYLLHGFTDSDALWFGFEKHWISVPPIFDRAIAAGKMREMIVVMPNALTVYGGSMYSSSAVTGDWELYVARELVAAIDAKYRTLAQAASRGLAGHSMGGYGAMRIGMKHPSVFGSVYLLSPCCLAADVAPKSAAMMAGAEKVTEKAQVAKADFMTKAMLASAAAWSPNPKNPPLYLDLPTKNGEFQPNVAARWAASSPLWMVEQYLPNLRRLGSLAMDAGDKDGSITSTTRQLHEVLAANGYAHQYESYDGNHINRIAERIETRMLPFFSEKLAAARRPNLNGVWLLDASKSELGNFPAPQGPQRVTQTATTLEVDTGAALVRYRTDGEKFVNETPDYRLESEAKWEGETLVAHSKGQARGAAMEIWERVTLSADGRTLTMERSFQTPQGEAKQKLVMVKQ